MPTEPGPEYEVGYARPPHSTRFKKGKSGNPAGRVKGSKNVSKLLLEALGEPVVVNENGERKRITKGEAMIKQLVNKGASGDARSIQLLLAATRSRLESELPHDQTSQEAKDQLLMLERLTVEERIELRRLIAKAQGDPSSSSSPEDRKRGARQNGNSTLRMELFCRVRARSNLISPYSTSHWPRIRWPSSSARPGISSNRPRRCCGTGISTPFANISRRSQTRISCDS